MPCKTVLPDGSVTYVGARGRVNASKLNPRGVLMQCYGIMSVDCFDEVIEVFDQHFDAAHALTIFVDGADFESYDVEYRARWIDWIKPRRAALEIHMYTKSMVVGLGLRILNLATGGAVQVYSSRADYEVAMRRLVPAVSSVRVNTARL